MISRSRSLAVLGAAALLGVSAFAAPVQAAAPAWAPVATSGPTNLPPIQSEIQRLAVDAEGGTFTLKLGPDETGALPFNVPPSGGLGPTASVQNALEALPGIGAGNVTVSGGVGGKGAHAPYLIAFAGALANTDVAQITADSAALTGGESHNALVTTRVDGGPGTATISLMAQNVGGFTSSGPITVFFTLPAGVVFDGIEAEASFFWSCGPVGPGISCTSNEAVGPGLEARPVNVEVSAGPGATDGIVHMTVSGGGAATLASYDMPLTVSPTPAPPGFQAFIAGAYDSNGRLDTRAGAHPYSASAGIFANTKRSASGTVVPSGEFKDVIVSLPPGFIGNPIAVPQCPESTEECPLVTAVGAVQTPIDHYGSWEEPTPVFNIQAPFGYPAKFKFLPSHGALVIYALASLRSDEDYGVEVGARNLPQITPVYGSFFTFWGAPADPSHDDQRCRVIQAHSGCEAGGQNIAFLTNATNCGEEAFSPPVTSLHVNTWLDPETFFDSPITLLPVTGCDKLKFESNFTFQPAERRADSPVAFATDLTVPSEGLTKPSKRTVPEQKKTVIHFPDGVVLNPSAADGLGACSEDQIGLKNEIDPATGLPKPLAMPNPIRFTKEPNTCPDSSKIGTIDLKSALLEDTLHGALYLAAQGKGNPFGSLFAVYLVIEDPQTGITVKLPGKVDPDPSTGQMTATFDNLPPLPFESLKLHFKGGSRSPFATPNTCGRYTTTTLNTPWSAPESGPDFETEDSFEIDSGPGGGACAGTPAQRPFDLGFTAGSAGTAAGAFSPFNIQITRPDGAQEIDTVDITTPPGFTAVLKGVPSCSDAAITAAAGRTGKEEQASPSCPAASQVGTTQAGAGSGADPLYTPGKLYLAGPYKGAPLSVVAITPAIAGPFDLGNVVVRSAVYVDPVTAQITAKTDPLPLFLDGVGLRLRDIRINLDRKDWALNPTSCEPSTVAAVAHGNSGAVDLLSTRFQVGNCRGLAFKPTLSARLRGGTHRNAHPSLRAVLSYPPGTGYANIKYAQVALPHSEFLDQSHINTVCTRTQFAAHACPAGSIYGHARATSPLLDYAVEGPVYLRSSDNKLPDLVVALHGPAAQPIEVNADGRIDSIHGGIRTTFEGLPDVPVSQFVLTMKGGSKGLLVNSRNLCTAKTARMTVRLIGQNGKRADQFPRLKNDCGKKSKKHR